VIHEIAEPAFAHVLEVTPWQVAPQLVHGDRRTAARPGALAPVEVKAARKRAAVSRSSARVASRSYFRFVNKTDGGNG
jgi:hypothetical protein